MPGTRSPASTSSPPRPWRSRLAATLEVAANQTTTTRPPITLIAASHLSDDDHDILVGISVMVLAIANRQNLADQPHMQEDETEGMEPTPCGSQNPDDPDRYCIREVGHSGRHKYRPMNGLVN